MICVIYGFKVFLPLVSNESLSLNICSVSGDSMAMRVRSMVGLIPLFACLTLEDEVIQKLPYFKKRLTQFVQEKPAFAKQVRETECC